ncbi:MAG: hypothetical protein KDB00_26015 [Planctomycetales bacterium]|nr:hypothetical protein [Planctomycetales bacterium]
MNLIDLKSNAGSMVLGVLDISESISDPMVARKYRDLTISWSRYDYRDEIVEADCVDAILERASTLGYQWCLVLPYGHVIVERWTPQHWQKRDLWTALSELATPGDFLVAGKIVGDSERWFGFEHSCLLVNLEKYNQLSAPRYELDCPDPIDLPRVQCCNVDDSISVLSPTGQHEKKRPALSGWNLIAASLAHDLPVYGFDDDVCRGILDLSSECPARTRAFAAYLGHGIETYDRDSGDPELGEDQVAFLNMVYPQTTGAPNGVFLWNIESYADIEKPREEFKPPISALYCVAAGFKPNRILQTHGFDASTRMVYFDYSPSALATKRYMVDHWDGEDFPDFIDQLTREFPHPQTFYQLWGDLTPDNVTRSDMQQMWEQELDKWEGAENFRNHWRAYVQIPHEFICCNLLVDPSLLTEKISDDPNAVIWWSNAFFTMYGNWFYSLDERKQMYERFIRQISRRNPELSLYGSDDNNMNVNSVLAGEYWEAYQRSEATSLNPFRMSKVELRM